MAYATVEDYVRIAGKAAPADVEERLDEASDIVDRLTYNRVRPGLDQLHAWQQELVVKAVCYQAEYLGTYAAYLSLPISGFGAGSVSVSLSDKAKTAGELVDSRALRCLQNSGLTSRRFL